MATQPAAQSTPLFLILQAVQQILVNGNGVQPGVGIDSTYVVEAYTDHRPRTAEPVEVCYALLPEDPFPYMGAGRAGHDSFLTLEITMFIRFEADPANADSEWSQDPNYGGLIVRQRVLDLFQDQWLFSSYNPVTFLPTGSPLLVEGMQQLPSPRPYKPDRETSSDGDDVGGYGEYKLLFSLKVVQYLSVPSGS